MELALHSPTDHWNFIEVILKVEDVTCFPRIQSRISEQIQATMRIINQLYTNTFLLQIIPYEEERDWVQLILSKNLRCVCADAGCYVLESTPAIQYCISVNRNTSQGTLGRLEGLLDQLCVLEGNVQRLPPSLDIISYGYPSGEMGHTGVNKYAEYMRENLTPFPLSTMKAVFKINPVLVSPSNFISYASYLARNVVTILKKTVPRNSRVANAVTQATIATYVNIYKVLAGSSTAIVHTLKWR